MEIVTFEEQPQDMSIGNYGVPANLDIEPGDRRISRDILFTSAVTECIALIAHNENSQFGLMAHMSSPATRDRDVFESSLQDLGQIGSPDTTQLYLIGGAPEAKKGLGQVQEDRDFTQMRAAAYLAELNLPRELLTTNWTEDRTAVDLTLDCFNGDLVIIRYPASDGNEDYGI